MKIKEIIQNGSSGPIFFVCVSERESEESFADYIQGINYLLVLVSVEDWNKDYGLWKSENPMGGSFGNGARDTLHDLKNIIKQIHQQYPDYSNNYIAGYSLAGLFSLWAYYECDLFNGAAVCSASLWYEGFDEYLHNHQIKEHSKIYLSLGGKEEKTKNEIVSTIGKRYRDLSKKYKNDSNVSYTTLVMNPGGHFTSSVKRMASGIDWLLKYDMK